MADPHLAGSQGLPSADCHNQQTVVPGEPAERQTHSVVQSHLGGASTADTVSRPDWVATPWPGLLGEVMPSPAALPRRERLEVAGFQAQRGKQLGQRGHSSGDPSGSGRAMACAGASSL